MNTTRVPLIGLLLIQLAIAYEWTMSGLTKIVRGGFPAGLAAELRDKSEGAAGWYRNFLDGVIIPHGSAWGYAIEISELLIGLALAAGALLWLLRWQQLRPGGRQGVLLTIVFASLAGIFMAVNFHLANGAPHPWFIPKDGFDEGVDLDSLLPIIQLIIAGVSLRLWQAERREATTEAKRRLPRAAAPLAR
jgi:hypothetical protein